MIATKTAPLESLRLKDVRELLGGPGPFITIVLPSYRPGEPAKSMAAFLKSKLKEAARQLLDLRVLPSIRTALLEPLEQLTEDPELLGGSHWGRAIFRSPGVFRQFELADPVIPSLTIGRCFEIRRFLADLHVPNRFYILKLSKKRVDLLRCSQLDAEPVPLPRGVPATLEDAMSFEPPDHDLENRSAAGGQTGAMQSVRFGTGSVRETQRTHLADFYKLVDRGLCKLFQAGDAPLVLEGVDEDTAQYHAINTYPHLLARCVHGSPNGVLPEHELLRQTYVIVRSDCTEHAVKAMAESKERVAPTRYATDLNTILKAATEGRVAKLYLDESAGMHEGTDSEDLFNAAAVETILHRGAAFTLPAGTIPEGKPAAAILRY